MSSEFEEGARRHAAIPGEMKCVLELLETTCTRALVRGLERALERALELRVEKVSVVLPIHMPDKESSQAYETTTST